MEMLAQRRRLIIAIAVIASLAIGALAAPKSNQPREIPLRELPKQVIELIQKKFPKAEIVHASLSYQLLDSNGWGVEIKEGKQQIQVDIDEISGSFKIISIANPMAVVDLPKPVLEALQAKYPQAKVKSAEEVVSGLMSLRPGETKPLDYRLTVVTAEKESLVIYFEPEMTRNAKGENEPNPSKMRIDWETPAKDVKD